MSDQTPTQPAALTASLHVQPNHVTAVALRPGGNLVALRLGDDNAQVSVLGTLADLYAIMQAAVQALDVIAVRHLDSGEAAPPAPPA